MAVTAIAAVASAAAPVGMTMLATVAYTVGTTIAASVIGGAINSAIGLGPHSAAPAPSSVNSQQARGILLNAASSIDPLPVIYGSRRVGGTYVIPPSVSGASNEYLHLVVALCEGQISAINTVYLDDTPTTDARFSGLVTVEKFLGTDTQAASTLLIAALQGKWTATHQGKGVAYLHVQIKADPNAFSGLPVVTADVDGRLVYDPRDGLTKFSNNPSLCQRDYLTSTRYGRGIASTLIDDASFSASANHCDELVAIPAGKQVRYTCDGVINVDDTAYANTQRMLTSCRGMLVFSGGKYKLVIDKAETPQAFTFNEDNITGAWEIARPGKRDRVNKVSASFFNPSNNWQPDIAIADSATYRAQDNGLVLERKLDLPHTADGYRAAHLAQLELKSTRFGLTARFKAFQEGLRCEVGDVVKITHSTPGWVDKPFRVMTIDIMDFDDVAVTVREYDDTAYTLDALNALPTAQQTTLPDPFAVGTPGNLSASEELYETRANGVKAKALVSCSASADIFSREYQLEYKLSSSSSWTVLPRQSSTSWEVLDIAPGVYDWRACAVNSFGVSSAYASIRREIFGLLARPAGLSGLVVQSVSALDVLTWTQSADLDVRTGGSILVRHSPALIGATWEASTSACPPLPGASTSAVLPLLAGTYLLKAQDSSGLQSFSAASFASNGSSLFTYASLGTIQEDPVFAGEFTNTYKDTDISPVIELVGAAMFDAGLDFDTGSSFDCEGGIVLSGSYAFASGLDLGGVKKSRLTATLAATAENVLSNFDEGIDFDSGLDFDNTSGAPVDAWVEVRSTDDNPSGTPAWGAWQRLSAADFNARGFEFRAHLSSTDTTYNIIINQLRIKAEAL